jgi:hypothetical protein
LEKKGEKNTTNSKMYVCMFSVFLSMLTVTDNDVSWVDCASSWRLWLANFTLFIGAPVVVEIWEQKLTFKQFE